MSELIVTKYRDHLLEISQILTHLMNILCRNSSIVINHTSATFQLDVNYVNLKSDISPPLYVDNV